MNAKWHVLALFVGLFFTNQSNAQYLSVKGDFEVDQQKGCHDITVTASNINPGTGTIIYQFDGFNSATTTNPTHTYTAPGTYWINQYIQGATGEKKDSVSVAVVAPETPKIELLSCNNFELLVDILDNYYDVYEINYGDGFITQINKNNNVPPYTFADNTTRNVTVTGLFNTASNRCAVASFQFTPTTAVLPSQLDSLIIFDNTSLKLDYSLPVHSISKLEVSLTNNSSYVLFKNLAQNTIADTVRNLNINQNIYCFRIATYDACSNFKSYSNEVCTINLNTSSQNNQITIDWSTIDLGGSQTAEIFRDGAALQTIAFPTIQHIDSTVVCNTTYCYQAEINFTGGGLSRSLEICETAFSTNTPPTIDNISSITNSDSIDWTWQIPVSSMPSYFKIYQVNAEGTILKSDTTSANFYRMLFDNTVKYMAAEIHDACNNTSPIGNVGSNIYLTGSTNQSFDIELNWNTFYGWIDGFQDYYVTIKDNQGVLIDSLSTNGQTNYSLPVANQVEQTMVFTVWAVPVISGIKNSRSNILVFERDPIISIPNSFTPNGDGLNDLFVVSGKFIASYELQVFNRWGEVLFQTTDLDTGWDGTSNNNIMPVGNYVYWMRIKDLNNNEHIRTGSILILSN